MSIPETVPVEEPALGEPSLRARLVRVLRVAFPHERFPDGPYERCADALIELASADRFATATLESGLASLDAPDGRSFLEAEASAALASLERVQHTQWFAFVRANTITRLYNDPEVWRLLGWEGPSFALGGYVHRGFDDLDWLPGPRIAEYEGEVAFTERGALPYPVRAAGEEG